MKAHLQQSNESGSWEDCLSAGYDALERWEVDLAETSFFAAAKHGPEGIGFHGLGAVAYARKQLGKALQYLCRAASLFPDSEGVWRDLGILYETLGKSDRSQHAFERALDADPTAYVLYRCLGLVVSVEKGPRHDLLSVPEAFCLACTWSQAGRHDDALSLVGKILELNPILKNDPYYVRLLAFDERLGRPALELLVRATSRPPLQQALIRQFDLHEVRKCMHERAGVQSAGSRVCAPLRAAVG